MFLMAQKSQRDLPYESHRLCSFGFMNRIEPENFTGTSISRKVKVRKKITATN